MNQVSYLATTWGLLFVSGCSIFHHRPPTPPPHPTPLVQAQPVQDPVPVPITAPDPVALIDELPPDVAQAMNQYMDKGKAPLIDHRKDGFMMFPFGLSRPVVFCRVMEGCDIQLEMGEIVSADKDGKGGIWMADAVRWNIVPLIEGTGEQQIVHLIAKPNDDISLRSTLRIATNRRMYQVALVSGAKETIAARFYYPGDELKRFNAQQVRQQERQKDIIASGPGVDLTRLNMHYRIECNGARFCPTWVADDGYKTYILLPRGLESIGLPALFIEQAGEKQIVNYNTSKLPYFILERVADKIILQSGTTSDSQQVFITREG